MVKRFEADSVLTKWLSEHVRLRVDFTATGISLSVAGELASAATNVLCLDMGNSGFIEIHLGEDFEFEFFSPDAMRVDLAGTIGRDYAGNPQKTGAGLVAKTKTVRLLIVELA